MAIRLTTLGRVHVHVDENEVPDLPAQRLRYALLVYLAVERDVSREAVLELFWPESESGRRRHACRQALYELRQALGENWLDASGDRIRTNVDVDVAAFEAAVAADRIDDAAALYHGEFLAGFTYDNGGFESWVERRRAHLGRLYRKVQRQRIAILTSAGRRDKALAAARAWVEVSALDDEAAHALIEQLALSGQRIAALQYYDVYVRQLREQLDVEPLDHTKELVESIRKGDFETPRPPEVAAVEPPAAGIAAAATVASAPAGHVPSASAVPAGASDADTQANLQGTVASHLWPRIGIAAAAILLIAASAVFVKSRTPESVVVPDRELMVLVAPFKDHSSDGSLGTLADRLETDLVRSLSKSELLKVISPSATEVNYPTPELDRNLKYMVAGSVSRSADSVFLALELIDGPTRAVLNSTVVQRPWDETRILVEDVVDQAATVLRRFVDRHVEVERIRTHTTSEEAWRAVLDGKAHQGRIPDLIRARKFAEAEQRFNRADSLFHLAESIDLKWAEPLVLRGTLLQQRTVMLLLQPSDNSMRRHDLLVQARDMADRAIARDENYAPAHTLRGTVLRDLAGEGPTEMVSALHEAERSLRRATQLDPLAQDAWIGLARILTDSGRYEEALDVANRAYRIDPYSDRTRAILLYKFKAALELGDDGEAQSWCQDGRARFPLDEPYLYCMFELHAWSDVDSDPVRLEEMLNEYMKSGRVGQPELIPRLRMLHAIAWARAGRPDTARAMMSRLESDTTETLLWMRASAHSVLGDEERALELLSEYLERHPDSLLLARSRAFSRLGGNPQYQRMVDMTGDRN